jgi:hypothetical protein
MSEWLDSQKKINSELQKLLKERIEKAYPRCELTAEENKRLRKLETIAEKIKRGENVQNRQLQTWLSEAEVADVLAKVREAAENGELDALD